MHGYNVVATMLRDALHVAHCGIASGSATGVSAKHLATFTSHYRYFINKFQNMHDGSEKSLERFQEAAAGDRVTREAYQSLNVYIFARQNTRVCANNLLRRCERIIRILWQSRNARNALIPAFEEHPERRLKDYLDAIQDYLRDAELPNGEGPYGSTTNIF